MASKRYIARLEKDRDEAVARASHDLAEMERGEVTIFDGQKLDIRGDYNRNQRLASAAETDMRMQERIAAAAERALSAPGSDEDRKLLFDDLFIEAHPRTYITDGDNCHGEQEAAEMIPRAALADVDWPVLVRWLRWRLAMSQEEMAAALGACKNSVSRWEHGARPARMARHALLTMAVEAGAMTEMDRCRTCGAMLRWAVTPKGKLLCLDAAPAADGQWVIEGADCRPYHPLLDGDAERYRSHWASCPSANAWRGKKR